MLTSLLQGNASSRTAGASVGLSPETRRRMGAPESRATAKTLARSQFERSVSRSTPSQARTPFARRLEAQSQKVNRGRGSGGGGDGKLLI